MRTSLFAATVLAVSLLAAPADAQTVYGLRAGLTASTYTSDELEFGTQLGFVAGGYARLPLSPVFAL